jgi:ubiquinone biosynthesis protein UbiJ
MTSRDGVTQAIGATAPEEVAVDADVEIDVTIAVDADVAALLAENARLRAQLARIVEDLHGRADLDVHVDLDAAPTEAMVRVTPRERLVLGPGGTAEVAEVAERLAHVQRDVRRVEQQVEKLLWRVGAPAAPLAALGD